MSLFKARDWWSTTAGINEEYDAGCLCLGNIDNGRDFQDKITVGSFSGILRIYSPMPEKSESGLSAGFKPEDLLIEHQLNNPILQLAAGRFVSANDYIHLAVLHPRKVSVYAVLLTEGLVGHGHQHQIKLVYEHTLQRTAFCMEKGPFGGVAGRDFICLQSMDGVLSIFEQETFAFSRFLPGFLMAGVVKYVQRTDSFVTVSSSWQVESYRYQALAVASDGSQEESQKISSGKRLTADWSFNIGEAAMDIAVVTNPPSILILGERNIHCVTDTGKLKFMYKLDYNPSCIYPYSSSSDGKISYLIGTHSKTLMVYEDIRLKWTSQLPHAPVAVRTAHFQNLQGLIVSLDDSGSLQCSYLGTDPSVFVAPAVESRDIDYNQQDSEMKELSKIIRSSMKGKEFLSTAADDKGLEILVDVPNELDEYSVAQETEIEVQDDEFIPSISVRICLRCHIPVKNVLLSIKAPPPIVASKTIFKFDSVDNMNTIVGFYLYYTTIPYSLTASAVVNYTLPSLAPRVTVKEIDLPLSLVMKPVTPIKNNLLKVTLDTNKSVANLNDVFPELLGPNAEGAGQALGFQFYGVNPEKAPVTLLASKQSQKYRVQSDTLECLWLPMKELMDRLSHRFIRGSGKSDFKASYSGGPPLTEYFKLTEQHFQYRLLLERHKVVLTQMASQFRAIQRRLLTRFKDKTPSPLHNLDTLLEGTYHQMVALSEVYEKTESEMKHSASSLSSATNLLCFLFQLSHNLSQDEAEILEACFSPEIHFSDTQGWEEMVDASLTHLLRTCLSKSVKDASLGGLSELSPMTDLSKLHKHIALLSDRLSKDGHLSLASKTAHESMDDDDENLEIGSGEKVLEDLNDTVPPGSKIGENNLKLFKKERSPNQYDDFGSSALNSSSELYRQSSTSHVNESDILNLPEF